ncbi:xylitol dehydrogenase [Stylosanthes scabra]|uniref:Xylitol dehydrogenase n=1 Tax=Stylosanthes scabra TaxID=79078 RepID=A0ABU6VEC9_9FABA|nr:xylitol dehydrogenase [Stylosanthes scabra]
MSSPGFVFWPKMYQLIIKLGLLFMLTCVGQVIGIVVADTHENAKTAARKVNVKCEDLPAILSIQDAINAGSFHPNAEKCLIKGDVDQCFR